MAGVILNKRAKAFKKNIEEQPVIDEPVLSIHKRGGEYMIKLMPFKNPNLPPEENKDYSPMIFLVNKTKHILRVSFFIVSASLALKPGLQCSLDPKSVCVHSLVCCVNNRRTLPEVPDQLVVESQELDLTNFLRNAPLSNRCSFIILVARIPSFFHCEHCRPSLI